METARLLVTNIGDRPKDPLRSLNGPYGVEFHCRNLVRFEHMA